MKAQCLQKIRNFRNQIIGYVLQYETGEIKTLHYLDLSLYMRQRVVDVVNLKLGSDGRIIDATKKKPDLPFCYVESSVLYQYAIKKVEYTEDKNLLFRSNIPDLKIHLAKLKLMNIKIVQHKFIQPDLLFLETENTVEFLSNKPIRFRDSNLRENMGIKPQGHFQYFIYNSIDMSQVDTSEMTNMGFMFENCQAKYVNWGRMNTANVTTMECMCSSSFKFMTQLDFSSFDTSKVENMSYMFAYCHTQRPLDLHNFNTERVKSMYGMFLRCETPALNIKGFSYKSIEPKKTDDMFTECRAKQIIR